MTHTISSEESRSRGNTVWHFGTVSSGDWDLNGRLVGETGSLFSILEQRITYQKDFKQIPEYVHNEKAIEQGAFIDGCSTKEEYKNRWKAIEALYWEIKENGFKPQAELESDNPLDEIRVQIGRKGDLLLEEGKHRIVIAQLLKLDRVPVLVTRRHTEWENLRQAVLKIVLQRGFIHQPFNHPDLDSLPYRYGNELKEKAFYGNERWDYIRNSLPISSGTVLDIGAYFGYFDHRFEDLGFTCFAVEPDVENLAVLHQYRELQGKQFEVWEKSIFEIQRFEFDIVLALNIFHHLVKTKTDLTKLIDFLEKLKCQAMYFEPQAVSNEYQDFTDPEFVKFVLDHTSLNQARLLGHTKRDRDLYLLTKI